MILELLQRPGPRRGLIATRRRAMAPTKAAARGRRKGARHVHRDNRFKVVEGEEKAFEQIWASRRTRLEEMEGFVSFHLLRGPEREDHTLYASHTMWETKANFLAWTTSQQFAIRIRTPARTSRSMSVIRNSRDSTPCSSRPMRATSRRRRYERAAAAGLAERAEIRDGERGVRTRARGAAGGGARRRIWEIIGASHCSIIGTCLTIAELRKIARRTGFLGDEARYGDYQIHGLFVEKMHDENVVARAVQKHLDTKYEARSARPRRWAAMMRFSPIGRPPSTMGSFPAPIGR